MTQSQFLIQRFPSPRLVASRRLKNLARGRIIGFIPLPRVLVLYEIQSVSSRIWTRVVVLISYDDTHYTTGTSRPFNNPLVIVPISCEFFTPALTDALSLESEGQQVSRTFLSIIIFNITTNLWFLLVFSFIWISGWFLWKPRRSEILKEVLLLRFELTF